MSNEWAFAQGPGTHLRNVLPWDKLGEWRWKHALGSDRHRCDPQIEPYAEHVIVWRTIPLNFHAVLFRMHEPTSRGDQHNIAGVHQIFVALLPIVPRAQMISSEVQNELTNAGERTSSRWTSSCGERESDYLASRYDQGGSDAGFMLSTCR